ncbi:MAG: hypothetical protein NVSMB9_13760 [Isosphaeraceae bacterium]
MTTQPNDLSRVLDVLVRGSIAWQTPAELAAAMGKDIEETTDLLCDLELDGWLVVWDTEADPLITLSALAAERLGVRLVEVGLQQTLRWARMGDPDPPVPRSKHVCHSERGAAMGHVIDPSISPELAAIRAERTEARALGLGAAPSRSGRPVDLPRPRVFIGLGLSPWPGLASHALCPACGNQTLPPHTYCLYCDRWGLDQLLCKEVSISTSPPGSVRKAKLGPDRKEVERLQAEHLRARRKAKREARRRNQDKAPHERHGQGPTRKVENGASTRDSSPAIDFTRPPKSAPNAPHTHSCRNRVGA